MHVIHRNTELRVVPMNPFNSITYQIILLICIMILKRRQPHVSIYQVIFKLINKLTQISTSEKLNRVGTKMISI